MFSIKKAKIEDLLEYNKLYKEYVLTQIELISEGKKEIEKFFKEFDVEKRNKLFIESKDAKSYMVYDNEKAIGFIEFNYCPGDSLFEKPFIYISNLYLIPDYRNLRTFGLTKKLFNLAVEWAKEINVKYICNDYYANNKTTESLNKILGFKAHKIRGVKEI